MQLLSASAYAKEDDETETFEITLDDDVVIVDMPPKKKYRLSHRETSDGNNNDAIVLKSVSPNEESLKLESCSEELTPVELAARNNVNQQLQELNFKFDQITQQVTIKIVYQGETCSAYESDSVTPTSTFTPDDNQQNVVLQPSKSNDSQNAYQLVMDPRLGLITDTLTPTSSSTMPSPLAKPQSPTPSVQTKQTRQRGQNSVPLPVQQQQPQQSTATKQQKLQPTESTVVGGVGTGPGTTTVQKNNTTISVVVDSTADDGRPAADSREFSFNNLQEEKTFPSLVVVARPHLAVKDISDGDRTKLTSKVRKLLRHVPTNFTEWLFQQGLVRSKQNCSNHTNTKLKLEMHRDVSKFPYSGGYIRISECCLPRFVSVFSGSLFEGSPHPPTVILKLIYHWACQTNVQNVVQWVKVDNLYVKRMNTWLRTICTVALHTHVAPLGGPGRRVEVGIIALGTTLQDGLQRQVKVEVLGLLESDLKHIRLQATEPLADGDRNFKKRYSKILEPLLQWVHPESIIVTDLTVHKGTLHDMGFAHVQQSTSSDRNGSNHTIMEYLRCRIPRMFQKTLFLLSHQIIQQFLDELVWREWFGTTATQCFNNMLAHLSEQTRADTGYSLIMRLNEVAANPFRNWGITSSIQPITIISKSQANESTFLPTKRTSTKQRKIINVEAPSSSSEILLQRPPRTISPNVPEQMVPLENYYYGTIQGCDPNANTKIGWTITCSMCKAQFNNNIKLMSHLFTHAYSISGGLQQCRYCLSSVGSQEGFAKHIITSHPYETRFQNGFICVICETRYPNSLSLGKHLSKEHVPAELPYQCDTCKFRCSSHRQAIDHFYKTHDFGATIQCPFCLKSILVWSRCRIVPHTLNFFMQHLQLHQRKDVAKKCPKCALWFIHNDTLKKHQINMHLTQRRKPGLIPWSAPPNGLMVPKSKQDKQVWEDTEREFNFSNSITDTPCNLVCKECKLSIYTPRHYQSLESCSNRNCQYITCCTSAMNTHTKMCKNLNSSLLIHTLPKEMYCVCGYSDDDGNILAKHLVECEQKSAYPSAEAAKSAIKTHSMLDVLDLARRPEEATNPQPTNPQPVVEAINLDVQGEKRAKKETKKIRWEKRKPEKGKENSIKVEANAQKDAEDKETKSKDEEMTVEYEENRDKSVEVANNKFKEVEDKEEEMQNQQAERQDQNGKENKQIPGEERTKKTESKKCEDSTAAKNNIANDSQRTSNEEKNFTDNEPADVVIADNAQEALPETEYKMEVDKFTNDSVDEKVSETVKTDDINEDANV